MSICVGIFVVSFAVAATAQDIYQRSLGVGGCLAPRPLLSPTCPAGACMRESITAFQVPTTSRTNLHVDSPSRQFCFMAPLADVRVPADMFTQLGTTQDLGTQTYYNSTPLTSVPLDAFTPLGMTQALDTQAFYYSTPLTSSASYAVHPVQTIGSFIQISASVILTKRGATFKIKLYRQI